MSCKYGKRQMMTGRHSDNSLLMGVNGTTVPRTEVNILLLLLLLLLFITFIQLLASVCTIRGSNPGGVKKFPVFRARPNRPRGPFNLFTTGTGSLSQGYSDWGVALTIHTHLTRLKKE